MKCTPNPHTVSAIREKGNAKAKQAITGASPHKQADTRTDSSLTSAQRRQAYVDSLSTAETAAETSAESRAAYIERLK